MQPPDATAPTGSPQARVARLAYAVLALRTGDRAALTVGFAQTPGGPAAQALGEDLARVFPLGWTPAGDRRARRRGDAVAEYLDALQGAAEAVGHCRLVEHAAGRCWFSCEGPDGDACGRVLSVAALLGAQPQRSVHTGTPR